MVLGSHQPQQGFGVIHEQHDKAVSMAIKSSFICPFSKRQTRDDGTFNDKMGMETSKEIVGWELGGRPDLLLGTQDDGQDNEPGAF